VGVSVTGGPGVGEAGAGFLRQEPASERLGWVSVQRVSATLLPE
jgi:hypothetical protein